MLNYHELTMDEPKNSKQRKLQFRVICIVMATCIVWALISSGALRPVEVTEGVFPGGEFFYRMTGRDYAASQSLINDCSTHLEVKESEQGNVLYTIYLDDPLAVNGRRQRFAGGYLLNDQTVTRKQESNEERKRILMQINEQIKEPSQTELEELSAFELWPKLKYSSVELPSVKAAVVEYTYSNGFVSALLHSYKVFPTIRKYAKELGAPGSPPVVVTTCSIKDSKCTHYVPLENPANVFRLGTVEYKPDEHSGAVNWDGVRKMFLQIVTFGKKGREKTNKKKASTITQDTPIQKASEPAGKEHTTTPTEAAPHVAESTEAKVEAVTEPETPVDETTQHSEQTESVTENPIETEAAEEKPAASDEVPQVEPVVEAVAAEKETTQEETSAAEEVAKEEPPSDETQQHVSHEEVPPAEESPQTEDVAPEKPTSGEHENAHADGNVPQTPERDEL